MGLRRRTSGSRIMNQSNQFKKVCTTWGMDSSVDKLMFKDLLGGTSQVGEGGSMQWVNNQVSWSSVSRSPFGQSSQAVSGPAWSSSYQGRSSNQFNQSSSWSNRSDGSRNCGSSSWSTRGEGSRTYGSKIKSQH